MTKRLIPVLLLDRDRRFVKTVRFGERTYIGDPFNVVRLFNEKEVDEIIVLDIDATPAGYRPDVGFLTELASECFMPLAYGGGIKCVADCEQLNRAGVEKFVLGNSGFDGSLIAEISSAFGRQAVSICIDIAGDGAALRQVVRNRKILPLDPLTHALQLQDAGAGEIIVQSIDRDGMRKGMDLVTISQLSHALNVPVVGLGGAGELTHLSAALHAGASAAASGSFFCFVGRLRAVLVTYPSRHELQTLIS
jgi:cyclase